MSDDQDKVNKTDIEWIKETLHRIEVQVVATNGRVKLLELWRAGVVGKVAGISMVVSAVVALGFALLK